MANRLRRRGCRRACRSTGSTAVRERRGQRIGAHQSDVQCLFVSCSDGVGPRFVSACAALCDVHGLSVCLSLCSVSRVSGQRSRAQTHTHTSPHRCRLTFALVYRLDSSPLDCESRRLKRARFRSWIGPGLVVAHCCSNRSRRSSDIHIPPTPLSLLLSFTSPADADLVRPQVYGYGHGHGY